MAEVTPQKNQILGLAFALLASLGLGGANYVNAGLSLDVGVVFIFIHFIPAWSLWIVYHSYYIIKRWRRTGKFCLVDEVTSSYYKPDDQRVADINC